MCNGSNVSNGSNGSNASNGSNVCNGSNVSNGSNGGNVSNGSNGGSVSICCRSESCNRLGSSSTTITIRKVDCGLISVPIGNGIHLKGTSYNTVT